MTESAPVVYLDTQDFSRFGNVLRGKADEVTERLFGDLECRARLGTARFVASMPLFGELLQYDADHRETTYCKAEAVERLCGTNAVGYPSRTIAIEIGQAAYNAGLIQRPPTEHVVNSERYWYPDVSDVFDGFRDRVLSKAHEAVANVQMPSRYLKRKAKKLVSVPNLTAMARSATPQFAAEYGLPESVLTKSIVACLQNKATPAEASRRLFEGIAEPRKFVEMYFERLDSDRSLPKWISGLGATMFELLETLRTQVAEFSNHPDFAKLTRETLTSQAGEYEKLIIGLAGDDANRLGLSSRAIEAFKANAELRSLVPSCQVFRTLLTAYIYQIIGFSAKSAAIEHSFGGDLIHALYIPHVDLWRSDRRFSALVRTALPAYSSRVISRLSDLPEAIDAFERRRP